MNTTAKLPLLIAILVPTGMAQAASDMDMSLFYWDKVKDMTISLSSFKHELDGTQYTSIAWSYFGGQFLSCYKQESSVTIMPNAKNGNINVVIDSTNSHTWRCSDNAPLPLPFSLEVRCTTDGMNASTGTGKNKRRYEGAKAASRYRERYNSNSANCTLAINNDPPVTTKGWLFNKRSNLIK